MAKSTSKRKYLLALLISFLLYVGAGQTIAGTDKNLWCARFSGRTLFSRKVRKIRSGHKTVRIGCGGGGRVMPVPLSHLKELAANLANFMKRNVSPIKTGAPRDIYPRGMFDYDVGVDQANYYSFGGQVGVQGG